MRISLIPSLVIVAAFMLGGCIQSEPAAPTVGVVDTARIFRDSEPGKAGVKFLEGMHEKMQADLNKIQEDLQKKPTDPAVQQKLQETYMGFQQRMGAEQQNVITLLNDATQRAMDTYRTAKKLEIILGSEAALSYSKAVDVTNDVIAELNKQKVEFKAMAPEAAAKEEVKEEVKPTEAKPAAPAQNATKPAAPAKK